MSIVIQTAICPAADEITTEVCFTFRLMKLSSCYICAGCLLGYADLAEHSRVPYHATVMILASSNNR